MAPKQAATKCQVWSPVVEYHIRIPLIAPMTTANSVKIVRLDIHGP